MPIKYSVIERGEPGITGGGTKKWYALVKSDGETTIDELVQEIEKFSALSEADIRGVIIALENVIQKELANGKTVRMDKLGSFSPGISSEGAISEDKFNVSMIKGAKVNYRPGKRISDALKTATFTKEK
ncbi:HU family DNA-binding protein [Frigoriflavimonas asaccharolytica]|uniref:Putative histone-like DNA-binding protein n=1 Tax=Frigoriflavimonas asaccharolytica TaxID=2735899 RepID=A0A8J8G5T8_9FLAO|nr:HU family DNA-binding protein [Frigoriflavimonas asaccharolytica]NRS91581.1 putative histone-like DNA-binding protein [Frigoriflavimonas asaccharolytica]